MQEPEPLIKRIARNDPITSKGLFIVFYIALFVSFFVTMFDVDWFTKTIMIKSIFYPSIFICVASAFGAIITNPHPAIP